MQIERINFRQSNGELSIQRVGKEQEGEGYVQKVLCAGVSARHADPLSYAVDVNGDNSTTRWPAYCRTCGYLANYRKR